MLFSMADAISELAVQAPIDPDAQATVTDFLDYTEYLPSDLIRSLTLIRNLDTSYNKSASSVHDLTKLYGSLPTPDSEQADPTSLRAQISSNLTHAIGARESSYAEASRLFDVVDRHFNRLSSIINKLEALPKPPSRDPTPVPQPSAQSQRSKGRKGESDGISVPRITLRLDGVRASGHISGSASRHRHRHRRVTVPGEVLPPPNPDSPPPSTDSDWSSVPPSPIPVPTSRVGGSSRSRHKHGRNRPHKQSKAPKIKISNPTRIRPPGVMGTNVHSAVAGISTSNALALLKPPPPDAVPGSEHAPWLKLTPWEMAKLRKRMKKNAVWNPSETMIRRELSQLARGPENYHIAKAKARAAGEAFVDSANIAGSDFRIDTQNLAEGEIGVESLGTDEIKLSNRGMKLNEAKKLKKESQAKEAAAAAAADAEQAARALAASGSALKNIFAKSGDPADEAPTPSKTKDRTSHKKRKRGPSSPGLDPPTSQMPPAATQDSNSAKKRRTSPPPPVSTSNTAVIAPPGPSPKVSTPVLPAPEILKPPPSPIAVKSSSRRPSVAPKITSPVLPPNPTSSAASRPQSRGTTTTPAAAPSSNHRARRSSTIPNIVVPPEPSRSTRSKRPAPGPVSTSSEGGTSVSVGRRKPAPRKSSGSTKKEQAEEGEHEPLKEIDPNEPRYCLCGEVGHGMMIACENKDSVGGLLILHCPRVLTNFGQFSVILSGSIWIAWGILQRNQNGSVPIVRRSWESMCGGRRLLLSRLGGVNDLG